MSELTSKRGFHIRIGLAAFLLAILFVLFVPVVYSSNVSGCLPPPMIVGNWTGPGGCATMPNAAGLASIGAALFGWGAVYGFEAGYSASLPWAGTFTTLGVLMLVALPLVVASVGCMAPEIVKKSVVTRAGLEAFGGIIFMLSALVFTSMLSYSFNSYLAVYGAYLFSAGSLMFIYGVRPAVLQSP